MPYRLCRECAFPVDSAHVQLSSYDRGAVAEMILETDLDEAKRLSLMDASVRMLKGRVDAGRERCCGNFLIWVQVGTGAFVPILIPFGMKYYGVSDILFDDFGHFLLLLAVAFSLIGSFAMTIENCRKYRAVAYGATASAAEMEHEIETYLSLAGVYNDYSTHTSAYKLFAARLAKMENCRQQKVNDTYGGADARFDDYALKVNPSSIVPEAQPDQVEQEINSISVVRPFCEDTDNVRTVNVSKKQDSVRPAIPIATGSEFDENPNVPPQDIDETEIVHTEGADREDGAGGLEEY